MRIVVRFLLVCPLWYLAGTYALSGRAPVAAQAPSAPCKCITMKASSTPANITDVCTQDDTGSICTLNWNVSIGQFEQAFSSALGRAHPGIDRFLPPKADCGAQGTAACDWMAFLRRDEAYAQAPGTVGAGFVLLLSAGIATHSQPGKPPLDWQPFLTLMSRAEEIGTTITKGGLVSSDVAGSKVVAELGCLRADLSSGGIVAVQNVRSRREGTCAPR